MIQKIKNFVRFKYPFYLIIVLRDYFRNRIEINKWQNAGSPPPHAYKILVVKKYAMGFSINNFIETGTYMGQMIYAVKNLFNNIYSIELDKKLYTNCRDKFSKFHHIKIIQGNSGELLAKVLCNISQPCLFWLDAHYSGGVTAKSYIETPILQEIRTILSHHVKGHCILIDDARLFVGENDYPTMDELKKYTLSKRPDCLFEVKDDIIRITFSQN